jgi:hypothetical protein
MVKSATLLFRGHGTLKKNGWLMTHHSGLIHPLDGWICTRIEECRQTTSPSGIMYKSEVIDKVTAHRSVT